MLYQYFRRPSFPSPGQGNTGKATVRRRLGIKSTVAFSLLLALLLTLSTVTFAAGSDPIYLGFTSDVHDQTERLRTWIDNLKPSAPTLDRMIFGGDYPDRMKENTSWTIAQQCVAIVQAAFDPNTPCVLVRGNHDKQDGNYAQGLVYNGDDYAVYAMDVDSSAFTSWSFFKSDIDELAAELDRIDASKPVFVASHIPIHYYSGRTIGNADALLTVLNRHENVIFLWGHNHTVNDPYYGKVMTEGFKIKTTSSGAEQAINFTYLAHGSILDGNYGAYGLLAALAEDGDDTKIDFSFKDLDGEAVSGGSVIIGGDAASGNIDSVALTGIRVPKTGETPDTTATTSSNKYTASAVSWDPADSPFAADTAYTASVTLTAKSGYNFTASTEATINGNDATNVTLDTEDTLIVSYTFPKTSAASGTTYQLTSSLESGETYVIVAQSGSDYYALTNATASSNFLAATSVKVQNDAVVASDVTDAMLWTAESAPKYMYLKNNGGYLKRVSGPEGKLNASSSTKPGEGYGEWLYDNDETKLYTISTSSEGSGSEFVLLYKSGSPGYFKAEHDGTNSIYLYKLTQGTPGVDKSTLTAAIAAANANKASVTVSADGSDVDAEDKWVTLEAMTAYEQAIAAAQEVAANADITQQEVNDAVAALDAATTTFNNAKQAGTKPAGTTYQMATSLEAAETYVIVAQSGSDYYALTNATASSNFLAATSVTVQNDAVVASDVTDAMLWTAESAPKYMYLKNNGGYLQRESGSEGKLNASENVPGEGYGEWQYENNKTKLYTVSTSGQGSGSEFVLLYKSGSPSYFQAKYQGTNTIIKLYKLIQGTPVEHTITAVNPIADLNVPFGTALSEVGLPTTVQVTLDDSSTQDLAVTWDSGTPEYNGNSAGTYVFKGTLTLVEGIVNPAEQTAAVNVIVAQAPDKEITSVAAIADLNVPFGTALCEVGLPTTVQVTLDDSSTQDLAVTWDSGTPEYDGNSAGTYVFKGTLTRVEGIVNPAEQTAAVNVIVAQAPDKEITSVAAIADLNVPFGTALCEVGLPTTVQVTLDDSSTQDLAVTWDSGTPKYDGNSAGTYVFKGTLTLVEGIANPAEQTAAVNVIVAQAPDKEITSVAAIADLNVPFGTALCEVGLPTTVQVTLDDSSTQDLAVTWDSGTPKYDGNSAGTYVFKGTLTLVEGIANPAEQTAAVNVIVAQAPDKEITSVAAIADLNVPFGTALSEVGLPTTVQVTLDDSSTQDLAVTWDTGTPKYDGNSAGTYVFKGTLTLVEGIVNPAEQTAAVNVIVAQAPDKEITSVAAIADLNVPFGTALSEVGLPTTVQVTLDDSSTQDLAVTWDTGTPKYDGNSAGTYVFKGTLTLVEGIVNPAEKTAAVNVIVAQAPDKEITSVAAIADLNVPFGTALCEVGLPTTVQVTLDDSSTQDLAVTWDSGTPKYDGNSAGTYVFKGTLTLVEGIVNPAEQTAAVNVIVAQAVEPEETYTVTFNSNGGTAVAPITGVKKDATVTLPTAPTKDGYVFGGWFTDQAFKTPFTASTPVTANITVYAKWTKSSGGGSGGGGRDIVSDEEITVSEEEVPVGSVYPGFKDVPENAWYYGAVKFATTNGLFKGISADLFGPDIPITRGTFVTILSRLEFGSDDKVPAGEVGFTDLTQGWYRNAIAWAYQNKIALGVSATEFDPDGILTREQMAAFLYRYAQYKGCDLSFDNGALSIFTDQNLVSDYAAIAMPWAVGHGLLSGVTETTLAPQDQATRAQSAAILMRFVSFLAK